MCIRDVKRKSIVMVSLIFSVKQNLSTIHIKVIVVLRLNERGKYRDQYTKFLRYFACVPGVEAEVYCD